MENPSSPPGQGNDTTRTPPTEHSEDEAARYEVWRRRSTAWDDLLRQCGSRYTDASFETYEADTEGQRRVVDALQQHVPICSKNGVLLFGPSGTGKDHLLVALARQAIKEDVESFVWVNGPDLFGAARDLMDSDQSEVSFLAKYRAPAVLILSDPVPLSGSLTAHQSSLLYRIIDSRYRTCRATWVTMNVASGQDAEGRLGVAIVDRLRDDALAMPCNWPSYRKPLNTKG